MKHPARLITYLLLITSSALCAQSTRQFQPGDILLGGGGEARTEADKEFASKFSLLRMANGLTPDGFGFSENTYRGPDGEKVYFRTFHYHSVERARAEFESRIKTATKVLDRAVTKHDGGGVDETAVLVTTGENGKSLSMIVANVGENFRSVQSNSSEDIKPVADMLKADQKEREAKPQ
jgi:hypothetical protein